MSKTPQEVEEYLRKYGPQSQGSPMAAVPTAAADPVADYLKKYRGVGADTASASAPEDQEPSESWASRTANRLRMGAQGATFGLADEASGILDETLFKASLGRFGKPYDQSVEANRARDAAYRERHPVEATAANVVGGASAALLSGGASLIPRAAGYLGKIGVGAATGAGAGALAGAGEAEGDIMTPEGRASRLEGAERGAKFGALLGGGFSAAAPAVSRVGTLMADIIPGVRRGTPAGPISQTTAHALPIGEALGTLRDATIRTTQERGDDILLQALERGGKSVEDVRSAVASRAGSTAKPESLMEIAGQPMQRLGRSVRTAPGRGSALMDDALTARSAGAEERIIADLLETSGQGKSTNRFQHLDDLIDERRANAKPLYEKAYAAGAIDDPDILATLELPQFQQALQRAQRIAKLEGIDLPDPSKAGAITVQGLDYVKRGLDDVIESGMKSGSIARTEARALRNRLKDMLESVDEQVPEYKAARGQFAGDSELIEAAERGKDLFKTHPDEARSYIESLSEAGKDAYRKQALSALQDRIENIAPGNNVSRRVGEKTLDQKRLRLLFPDDASFDTFRALLQREAEMHGTKGFVMGGSQTADKIAELADLAGVSMDLLMSPTRGLAGAADLFARRAGGNALRGVTERNAEAIAGRLKLGMGRDGNAEFDELLKALAEAERRRVGQQARRGAGTVGAGSAGGQSQSPRNR